MTEYKNPLDSSQYLKNTSPENTGCGCFLLIIAVLFALFYGFYSYAINDNKNCGICIFSRDFITCMQVCKIREDAE